MSKPPTLPIAPLAATGIFAFAFALALTNACKSFGSVEPEPDAGNDASAPVDGGEDVFVPPRRQEPATVGTGRPVSTT